MTARGTTSTPAWLDGTDVGGSSFLFHVRHAVAAIRAEVAVAQRRWAHLPGGRLPMNTS